MVIQPTQLTDTETTTENTAAGTDAPEFDLSSLVPAALLESAGVPPAVPVEGQLRTLRVLDADTAVVVEPDSEIPVEPALGDVVVIEAAPLVPGTESVDDVLEFVTNGVAEAHSHAAPPPLTEPGEVIELLSGTEALVAIDALAPFELSEGSEDDSFVSLIPRSELASAFGESAAAGGDLLFLDFTSFAKPENPGNGGGGGGNGGGKGGGKGGKNGGDDTVGGDPGDPDVLSSYLSGDPGGYNILIEFEGNWTAELQGAFIWAADWISSVITSDIQDVLYLGNVIDDLLISAELTYIDGTGGILGQAGPTAVRTDGYLPATGIMEFDVADADSFNSLGLWDDIVVHEMLHTVGFGTIWGFLDLVDGSGTDSPTFMGLQASLAYADLLHQSDDPVAVPLEEYGGSGTAESHWDEETFLNEIMTGFINGSNYMSDITVASLDDLGYETIGWTNFNEFTV